MARVAVGRLGCGLLALLAMTTAQFSRAADRERVKFNTVDRAEIHGVFYPSDRGAKAPCALLLHAIGGNSEEEGWVELAKKLKEKGFAVLAFDFRGHGDSKNVDPDFWTDPVNRTLKGYRGKPKEQIDYKEFSSVYQYAMLVNDITAAKRYLDHRSDNGDCNSANVVAIGAETGATLGAMWVFTEWQRPRQRLAAPGTPMTQAQRQGEDIAGAIWLSISPSLGPTANKGSSVPVDNWLRTVRERLPMYFLYGEQDNRAASFAKHMVENVLRADKDNKLKLTGKLGIKGTKLAGRDLLGKAELGTEDLILRYAEKVLEDRSPAPQGGRDAERSNYFIRVPIEYYLRR